MSAVFYYLIIKPLSHLPFWVLYRFSDFIFFLSYHLFSYRKKVIRGNLNYSFPDKKPEEISTIMRKFYHHLCDLLVESVKLFSIPDKELKRRFKKRNPELMNHYFDQGKSVIVVASHYNNWEMAGASFGFQLKHKVLGIYSPLHNKYLNNKIKVTRSRSGVNLVASHLVKRALEHHRNDLIAPVFGSDQSPTYSKHIFWTRFLHQDTAVFAGPEMYAKEYDFPVIYCRFNKLKRGFYDMEFILVEENPQSSKPGAITEHYTNLLEQQILGKPEFWLWSHRRWKRKKVDNE